MGKDKKEEQNYSKQPFLLSVEEILNELGTKTDSGLSSAKVSENSQKYGENHLEGDGGVSWYSILGKQISNAMILVCSYLQLPWISR